MRVNRRAAKKLAVRQLALKSLFISYCGSKDFDYGFLRTESVLFDSLTRFGVHMVVSLRANLVVHSVDVSAKIG